MGLTWSQAEGRLGRGRLAGRIGETVSRFDLVVSLALAAYVAAGVALLPSYLYRLNPDGVSYISVAQKYLAGNFSSAVNGYWAPLFSWLMTPYLALTSFPLLAEKQLALTIGFFTLLSLRSLALTLGLSRASVRASVVAAVPLTLFMALCMITPDLLMVGVLCVYLSTVFNPAYSRDKFRGALCGALGAAAYFAKSYGFPFFLAHFIAFNCVHYFRSRSQGERRVVLHNFVVGFLVFLTISGFWVASISKKYDHLTISTAASYNLHLTYDSDGKLPMFSTALIQPTERSDTSIWIDPSYDMERSAAPRTSEGGLKKLPIQIAKNVYRISNIFAWGSVLVTPIFLLCILYCIPYTKQRLGDPVFYVLGTVLIYCGGYSLIFVLQRYIVIAIMLVMLSGYFLLDHFRERGYLSRTRGALAVLFLTVSFWTSPVQYIATHTDIGKADYEMSKEIRAQLPMPGNIASNIHWIKTSYLAFYNEYAYFGATSNSLSDAELENTLQENGIDYYFVWGNPRRNVGYLRGQREITNGSLKNLKIYRVRSLE